MSKKQVIKLTESDLHNIIKESVNKILVENKHYDSVMYKCNDNLKSVVYNLGNKIKNLYSSLVDSFHDNDRELYSKAMNLYNELINYDIKYQLPYDIWKALDPMVTDYTNTNKEYNHKKDFDEPEDWYERNEHGDFDTY